MDGRQTSDDVILENFRVRGVVIGSPLYAALSDTAVEKGSMVLSDKSGSSMHMRKVLQWMILESYLIAYAKQLPKHGVRLINYPEMAMICGLHLELRIGNKLIKLLLSEAGSMCKVCRNSPYSNLLIICTCSLIGAVFLLGLNKRHSTK